MTLIRIADPAVEPLAPEEVRAYLRLGHAGEEATLGALVAAARQEVERRTEQALIDQEWRLVLDDWPPDGVVRLRRGPVRAIRSVTVYGADGAPNPLPATSYVVDTVSEPARILFSGGPQPGIAVNGIEIDFRCGYGASGADVPDLLKRAMLMLVAEWYEYRGVVAPSEQPVSYPAGFDRLVGAFRPVRLG